MSGPGDIVRAFEATVRTSSRAVFANVASAAHESIVNGSPLTGAPGQPVDIGTLKGSFILTFPSPTRAEITTNVPWAKPNEDGVTEDGRPYIQRSPVGGRHSLALTGMGLPILLADEIAKAGA